MNSYLYNKHTVHPLFFPYTLYLASIPVMVQKRILYLSIAVRMRDRAIPYMVIADRVHRVRATQNHGTTVADDRNILLKLVRNNTMVQYVYIH